MQGSGTLWQAGSVLYANYMRALRAAHADEVALFLTVPGYSQDVPPDSLVALVDRIVELPALTHGSAQWVLEHVRHRLTHGNMVYDRTLKQNSIHVRLCGPPLRRTNLPTLALIPDFQHRYLPEFFTAQEIQARESSFHQTVQRATRILLLSEAVRREFEEFAPQDRDRAHVIAPEPLIPDEVYQNDPQRILTKYDLPSKFVYLPNQMWQHKNHLQVVQALHQLRARGIKVFVVCTGLFGDYRNTSYVAELLQTISLLGVRDQFGLLGLVPRGDVFDLIRQSVCVLNPSLFEGYGLSLAEARAVGKRVLVSDIPAHREQDAPCAVYFAPRDVQDLANKLGQVWANTVPGPDVQLEASARALQPARVHQVGDALFALASQVAAL